MVAEQLIVLLVAAVLGTGAATAYWVRAYGARRAMRRRFTKAAEGEARARILLERWGYDIVAEKPRFEGSVTVDGEARPVAVSPDFLVERGRELAVVEVKTGAAVTNPTQRSTRRQLREYDALVPADALYLLDADEERLMRIDFPAAEARQTRSRALIFVMGVAIGAATVALVALLLK